MAAVGRNAQPTVLLLEARAGACDEKVVIFLLDRQHVVFELYCLSRRIAQAVDDAGAQVGELFLLFHGAGIVEFLFQTLLFFGRFAHVFNVHRCEFVEFQSEFLFAAHIQRKAVHRCAFQFGKTAAVRRQIPSFELEAGAAVGKACLVDRNAVQGKRVVYPDGVFADLAGFFIGNFQIAGKITRHAGIVEIDVEFFQFDRKRQLLNQKPLVGIQENNVGLLPFAEVDVAPE